MKKIIVLLTVTLFLAVSATIMAGSPVKKSLTYSQVLKTYPADAKLCNTTGDIMGGNDQGITVGGGGSISIGKGQIEYQCSGTKLTVKMKVTLEGKTYKPGTKMTVDKNLKWIEVSSCE